MHTTPALSVVVPVYNEQDNLERLVAETKAALGPLGRTFEIVLVDDGSTDASLAVIRNLAAGHPEVRYLSFARNRGQSAAFCAGFDAARFDLVVTMDADLQNDPADIPALLDLLGQGFDLAAGWRAKRRDTWIKRVGSRIANAVRRNTTGHDVTDTGCSLKVMRRDMLQKLPRFKGMHRFLPTLLKLHGARIAEQQVHHRPRHAGTSKYGTWDRAFSGLYDLFGVRWLMRRHIAWSIREQGGSSRPPDAP